MQEQCPSCGGYWVARAYPFAGPLAQMLTFLWLLFGSLFALGLLVAAPVVVRHNPAEAAGFLVGAVIGGAVAKEPIAFRISPEAVRLLAAVSEHLGITKTAALEMAIRLLARREGVS